MTPTTAPTVERGPGYTVRARTLGGGRAEVSAATATIEVDSGSGAPSGAPGPAELLASAFAACLLKNIERFGDLLPFSFESADVDVTAHRQESPPRFTDIEYAIRIVTDEPDRRIDLLHENLRRHGTVYNTLASACRIDGTITAVRRA